MKLFSRKGKAPDALVASTDAHVGGSARILAWAQTEDGYVVALPDRMLILRTGGPTEELGWHDILHGVFTEDGDLRWERMSTPTSAIAAMAPGCTSVGSVPAL